MPTYDYRCAKCGDDLEVYQTFSEAPLTRHKGCGGKLAKVLSPAGIVLKGSGFYKTDNRSSSGKKSSDRNGKDSPSTNGDSSAKADTGQSESRGKSESKSSSDTKSSSSSSESSSSDTKKPAAKSA